MASKTSIHDAIHFTEGEINEINNVPGGGLPKANWLAEQKSKLLSQPELIILVGPPGSGKSFWSQTRRTLLEACGKTFCEYGDYVYVNQDTQGKQGHLDLFNKAVADHKSIVIDRMNFSKVQRDRYQAEGYKRTIIVFQVPYDVCLSRCVTRANHATIHDEATARRVLGFFFSHYEKPTSDEGEVEFQSYVDPFSSKKRDCIIVDLDGTLCNVNHRLHFMHPETGKRNWKAFFEGMKDDTPNLWCVELIDAMTARGFDVVFSSGRPNNYRTLTMEWLNNYFNMSNGKHLFMRAEGDYRADNIAKEIIYDFEIAPRFKVLFVVDDRQQVVNMWRGKGVTCLQCDKGDF